MLTLLSIENFTIIPQLELSLDRGLTAITGETGAGKSIICGALGQALGQRADSSCVAPGSRQAEIAADFDIRAAPAAQQWLAEREFADSDGQHCLLRRIISADGRSRAYINGHAVALRELQALGTTLGNIHGQHGSLMLFAAERQMAILTAFGELQPETEAVQEVAERHLKLQRRLKKLRGGSDSMDDRLSLLQYQVNELEKYSAMLEDLPALEDEHRRLAAADQLRADCAEVVQAIDEDESGVGNRLGQIRRLLEQAESNDPRLHEPLELLTSAQRQVDEARRALGLLEADFQSDPERLQSLENQLAQLHQLARRHRVSERELPELYRTLKDQLATMEQAQQQLADGDAGLNELAAEYRHRAQLLSAARKQQSERLCAATTELLGQLAMPHCRFSIELRPRAEDAVYDSGAETVHFLAATNPGHPPLPLEQVASGGELSRLSLALQVATLGKAAPLCLVFDEVDSGVGSSAAEHVGRLLKSLSQHSQVLCVTHLAQVAGLADRHLLAGKQQSAERVETSLRRLDDPAQRIEEIARMIGGKRITAKARAHAAEILASGGQSKD